MADYTIARAEQTDLAAIVEIYNSTISSRQSTADLLPVSVADRQAWFDSNGENRPIYKLRNNPGQLLPRGSFSD